MTGAICDCKTTLPMACASLIPQPWMRTPKHCPAVRCRCGKRYYSLSYKQTFDCQDVPRGDADDGAGMKPAAWTQ